MTNVTIALKKDFASYQRSNHIQNRSRKLQRNNRTQNRLRAEPTLQSHSSRSNQTKVTRVRNSQTENRMRE